MTAVAIKRVYAAPEARDGTRILVDRLWPRGITKSRAKIDLWLKEIAPSDTLRKRFHAKPDDWAAFCTAYFAELEDPAGHAAAQLLFVQLQNGPVTLLYATRDQHQNNAVALRLWLAQHQVRNVA